MTLQHLLGTCLPLPTFSPDDHHIQKVVDPIGHKTLTVSNKTKRMDQAELCQIWKALMNLNLQYLPFFFLLIWLPLYDFLPCLHFYAVHLSGPSVSQFIFLCLILLSFPSWREGEFRHSTENLCQRGFTLSHGVSHEVHPTRLCWKGRRCGEPRGSCVLTRLSKTQSITVSSRSGWPGGTVR